MYVSYVLYVFGENEKGSEQHEKIADKQYACNLIMSGQSVRQVH